MLYWLNKRRGILEKEQAFGDHIQTLARICGEKDEQILQHINIEKHLAGVIIERNKLIGSLLNALDNHTIGFFGQNYEHPMFKIVFNVDERIAIKRAKQLLEDAVA